jgi:hypothetical protein
VLGNLHARFLGGKGALRLLPYPANVMFLSTQGWQHSCKEEFYHACHVVVVAGWTN